MTFDFGWKGKAERLRGVMVSAGHTFAKEMPTGLFKILEMFRRVHATKDGTGLKEEIDRVVRDNEPLIWEPLRIRGWNIEATMYIQNGQLWWLAHAARTSAVPPSSSDVSYLHKILEHLGADVSRDMIIGPGSEPPGENAMPFGWWTWFNRAELFEIQVRKGDHSKLKPKDAAKMMRVVPLGTAESDGFTRVDRTEP